MSTITQQTMAGTVDGYSLGVAGRNRMLVIVPTYRHPSTLDLAVGSALRQTVEDLDVVIIGDGVEDDTRDVVADLQRTDRRVHFVDRPKGPSRNEESRDEVIRASDTWAVTYLGDDDLLLPDHVEVMLQLLDDHDFAHPRPIFLDADERVWTMPSDLSDPEWVAWHQRPRRNTISLTGASHTSAFYRQLPHGWRPPPEGFWSDHFMWATMFAQPGARLVTCPLSTTVKPPAHRGGGLSADEQRRRLLVWDELVRAPDARERWNRIVDEAVTTSAAINYRSLIDERELAEHRSDELVRAEELLRLTKEQANEQSDLANAQAELLRATESLLADARFRMATLETELDAMKATRTWRLRNRLLWLHPGRR